MTIHTSAQTAGDASDGVSTFGYSFLQDRNKPYEITMAFDSVKYDQYDTITITSTINYPPPIDAHFDIYDFNNVLVYSGVETMLIEKPFTHTLIAGEKLGNLKWETGTYTAIGWYDANLGENATATFQYVNANYRYDLYDDEITPSPIMHIDNANPDLGETITVSCELDTRFPHDYGLSYLSVFYYGLTDEISYTELTNQEYVMAAGVQYTITQEGDYHVSCLFTDNSYIWLQADYREFSIRMDGCPEVAYWHEELQQCVYWPDI